MIDNPCGQEPYDLPTQCSLKVNLLKNKSEIIIPKMNSETQEACTDIFDLETMTWRKMENDNRVASHGGFIMRQGLCLHKI